jgi:hypothetical protein
MKNDLKLSDVWRVQNPNMRKFTWRRRNTGQSRIDYFLVSNCILGQVDKCEINLGFRSEHSSIFLGMKHNDQVLKGRGMWKFNNSLLKDDNYIAMIESNFENNVYDKELSEDSIVNWDCLKMMIRRDTISYSIRKAKHNKVKREEFAKNLLEAEKAYNDSNGNDKDIEEKYYAAKAEWQSTESEWVAGAMVRSRARWVEQGEKNNKYFLGLEKRNQEVKSLKGLINDKNVLITEPKKMLNEVSMFYENLFRNKDYVDGSYNGMFTSDVKLDNDTMNELEGKLTIEECGRALKEMKNNKSPGSDGLTIEFFKHFWHLLSNRFLDCLNKVYEVGEMSLDQRTGVITIIPKEGKDPRYIKNWRPITLLNVDYKILVKTLANRLKMVLPDLINEDQTAYVKDRLIGYNVRIVNDLIDYCKMFNYDGLLLMLDFEKAFDSLSWEFITHTLQEFGFGPVFIKWIQLLYHNICSYVISGGILSKSFRPERGIRQGCPISAYIFILNVELLAQKLRASENIHGLQIGNKEFKIMQFADDTILMLQDKKSILNSLELLENFKKCSGLKLNTSKTEAYRLGNNLPFNIKDLKLKWVESFKYLGIWFCDNLKDMEYKNYRHRLDHMRNLLRLWKLRDLSLKGKVLVLKSLAFSQIIYPLSLLEAPGWVSSETNDMFYDFLWDGKGDKIKRTTVIRNIDEGGLKMPDVDSMAKALKVTWLIKMCDNENHNVKWATIPKCFSPEIYFPDFCICNFTEKMIIVTITPFYRQCLIALEELRNGKINEAAEIKEQTLWYNKNIKQGRNPLFIKNWYQKGIMYVSDLLNNDNNFLSFEEFTELYDLEPKDFLRYITVINCIPRDWKRTLKSSNDASEGDGIPKILVNNEWSNIENITNRELYNLFIKTMTVQPLLCEHFWQKTLGIKQEDLSLYYRIPYASVKDTKIQSLQYKIIHNIYITRLRLHQWRLKDSSICLYCDSSDDLLHHFCHCNDVTLFWNTVINCISQITDTLYEISDSEILLGITRPLKHRSQLNFIILQGKWFIFTKKYVGIKCCALEFLPYLKHRIKVEWLIHMQSKQIAKFDSEWGEIYNGL